MNKISFIHTHYFPPKLLKSVDIDTSVVALEVYPDLLSKYYGDYDIFDSLEECISWHNEQYSERTVKFTIENVTLLKEIKSLKRAKELGLIAVQLFHSQTNAYFDKKRGLTVLGHQLLRGLIENDLILDLSHLNDNEVRYVLSEYSGKIMVSHCVCSDLIETIHPRTNAMSSETIKVLSEHGCLFGIPFINDLVSKISHDTYESDSGIMQDIFSQILYFVENVGSENVALGPDFMDTEHFSKVFKQNIKIPDILYEESGYQELVCGLRESNISEKDIMLIMSGNVKRIIGLS